MASAHQLKALLKSHMAGDDEQFLAVAMQVAAHEAKQGHGKLALELRELIEQAKQGHLRSKKPTPLAQPKGELGELLTARYPQLRLNDLVLPEDTKDRLVRLIKEHRQSQKIRAYGLVPRRKVLLLGPPGTGKTMTSSVLTGELGLPLFIVRLDGLMTKYLGETAAKLRIVFQAIDRTRGVYLFDEFDSIGAKRGFGNDVGEIRRVLNSFLQLIELDNSDSLLIAATNHAELLDRALLRRFDDVIEYALPDAAQVAAVIKAKVSAFPTSRIVWNKVCEVAEGLSHGDIASACEDAVKHAIIHDKARLSQRNLTDALVERRRADNRRIEAGD
ncbi:MAG: AAA family ATPase [Gammaproteobacteria bacterium]|nr:AAA family ATPase [Gammaproteobacteria bacterium]